VLIGGNFLSCKKGRSSESPLGEQGETRPQKRGEQKKKKKKKGKAGAEGGNVERSTVKRVFGV